MKTNLILDLSNLVWITKYSTMKGNSPFSRELIIHDFLLQIRALEMKYKADGILVACDERNLWRKEIYPEYKGQRDKKRDPHYEEVRGIMDELKDFFNNFTKIPAISVPRNEADDVIAIASRISTQKNVIVSSDKDFIQLINDKTILYSPPLRAERETKDKEFELFEKCIRGDSGDNVFSAYPRVRTKVLEAVWGDELAMANLFETKRKIDGRKVGEVYEFNKSLIDLDMIPQDHQDTISDKIIEEVSNGSKFNYLGMLRFFGQNNLKKLAKQEQKFSKMFNKGFIL